MYGRLFARQQSGKTLLSLLSIKKKHELLNHDSVELLQFGGFQTVYISTCYFLLPYCVTFDLYFYLHTLSSS